VRARGARPRVRCGCCPGRADGFASPRRAGLLGRISVVVGPLVSGGVRGVYRCTPASSGGAGLVDRSGIGQLCTSAAAPVSTSPEHQSSQSRALRQRSAHPGVLDVVRGRSDFRFSRFDPRPDAGEAPL
jgi:hypothetical protein